MAEPKGVEAPEAQEEKEKKELELRVIQVREQCCEPLCGPETCG